MTLTERVPLRLKVSTQNDDDHRLGELTVQTTRRRLRFAAVYGTPPGSHIGLWRTRWGSLTGLNLRVGRRYRTCLTLMIHHTSTERRTHVL